jgi:protein O-GlcNAc transferase
LSKDFEEAVAAQRAGRLDAAIEGYGRVLAKYPRHDGAMANLASCLKSAGRPDEAMAQFQRAVQSSGAGAETWFNYGNLLRDVGDVGGAQDAYRTALGKQPGLAPASVNLARLLAAWATRQFRDGKAAQAEPAFREAVQLQPTFTDAHVGLGMALKDLGRPGEAIGCWQRAVALDPRNAAAHNNLGAMYRLLKRPADAVRHLREAVKLVPGDSMSTANLAHALLEQGATSEAMQLARGIVAREPQSTDGHMMLGFALAYQGEVDAALGAFLESHRLKPEAAMPISNALFTSLYSDARDAAGLLELHTTLAREIVPAALPPLAPAALRAPAARLRIGYLSPDLRSHPVSTFFEPVLSHHDMEAFEVHCYSTAFVEDAVTQRLRATGAIWHACAGWTDERIAAQIRADGIDVLVDLAGHTAQNRAAVLRAKPAPVQALYIGYPGTTGLPEVDYLIADARVCPPGHERFCSERVVRLGGSFWCFRPPSDAPAPSVAPSLHNGFVTFGSFNALQKLTPSTFAMWIDLLREVPDARLVLKSLPFADAQLRETVARRFTAAGVAGERVAVLPPSLPGEFLAEYGRVDVALDPSPYNGGTTTFDALWMGVPVVTLPGERFCSRMAASVLGNLGLDELVAASASDYVAIAARLAREPARLQGLRSGLRERLAASPCCDAPRAARELEAAFRDMRQR